MMRIEKMSERHVAQVAELERVCFTDPWSEASISSQLHNPLSLWLVALDGERIAGYIGSQSVQRESDMMNVAVAPAYRRQGIAKQLVMQLAAQLKVLGNESLTLEVRVSNESAIALYEKLAFEQIGRRPNYYRNPKEDALILRKVL